MHFVTVSVVDQFVCEHAGIKTVSPLFAWATALPTSVREQLAAEIVAAFPSAVKTALRKTAQHSHLATLHIIKPILSTIRNQTTFPREQYFTLNYLTGMQVLSS
jgi:hypothetical protein